jgi:hypothetical protein
MFGWVFFIFLQFFYHSAEANFFSLKNFWNNSYCLISYLSVSIFLYYHLSCVSKEMEVNMKKGSRCFIFFNVVLSVSLYLTYWSIFQSVWTLTDYMLEDHNIEHTELLIIEDHFSSPYLFFHTRILSFQITIFFHTSHTAHGIKSSLSSEPLLRKSVKGSQWAKKEKIAHSILKIKMIVKVYFYF